MQIMMHLWGGGLSIPKTKIGVSTLMGAVLSIRAGEGHTPTVYATGDLFAIGTKSGTLVAGSVKTKWINVDSATNEWLSNCEYFEGKNVEIAAHGTLTGDGFVDITLATISDDGVKTTLLKRFKAQAAI